MMHRKDRTFSHNELDTLCCTARNNLRYFACRYCIQ